MSTSLRSEARMALPLLAAAILACAVPVFAQNVTEGQLQALDKDQQPLGMCPLKHTDVRADISGFIARVTLAQQFENPYPNPIEAVYCFPMSDRGAVDRMTMTIGDRVVRGVIKEREEARRIYEAARDAGQAASLLDQERPNIFTQSVANIMPGESIKIEISYVEYLEYEEGRYAFSFPMVVGPRYIPGTPQDGGTDQVPDANRITPPVTPEGTRAGHDIALAVTLDAGVPIQALKSELHEVDIERPAPERAVVKLKDQNTIPNRDFMLEYVVAQEAVSDAVLTHVDARGGFVTLMLVPPKHVAPAEAAPKEMIFVIDCSGSMMGFPIEKAKQTMKLCIEQMNPKDTFNLVSFSGGVGYCFKNTVPNTPENRQRALEYLDALEGRGGTEMMNAIRAALGGDHDPDHLRIVCFMTDGFIGNDMEIVDEVKKTAGTARVFSFGIGSSVNRYLLENMAREGRGEAEIVSLEGDSEAASKRFHDRIQSPVLTDLSIDFGGLDITQVYPAPDALPDLFSAKPVILTGRYKQGGTGAITLRGKNAAGAFERKIDVNLPAQAAEGASRDVLASLWARKRIDDLMAQDWAGNQSGQPSGDIKKQIIDVGIEFSLVSQYTSFVAVEEKVVNEGGKVTTVQVPVEMPDGVSYEGVFGDGIQPMGREMAMGSAYFARGGAASPGWESMPTGAKSQVLFAEPSADASAPAPVAVEEKPKAESETSEAPNPKIDAALHGLAGKLVNGNYTAGKVEVKDGWVKVFVYLAALSDANQKALRDLGVDIISVRHTRGLVLARVRVADLNKVAALDSVTKITPPAF